MIAFADDDNRSPRSKPRKAPAWHAGFLKMVPAIRRQAKIAFRHFKAEAREEAVQEVLANAMVAYVRLFERGKEELAYPSVLGLYGIRQVREGRRVGSKLNVRDVSSEYCQLRKGVAVERLDRFDREEGRWHEVLVEDRRAGPAETAAARIDVGAWMRVLGDRNRRIAEALATGSPTGEVAREFKVSASRISQMRRNFADSWRAFHGEGETAAAVCALS